MKNLNRILLTLGVGYLILTLIIIYNTVFGTMPFSRWNPFYGGEWKLVWNDEFDASVLDYSKWTPVNLSTGFNNELQAYRDENVSIKNGYLVITSKKEHWTGPDSFHPGQAAIRSYTSGRVETRNRFAWTYGRFEMRAKLPGGRGLYSYAALFPVDGSWPPSIHMVAMRGTNPRHVFLFSHWGTYPNYKYQSPGPVGGLDYSADFHIYSLEWEPRSLRWFIDGVKKYETDRHVPNQPLFIELGTPVGGTNGGPPDDTLGFHRDLIIDWFRVYQRR